MPYTCVYSILRVVTYIIVKTYGGGASIWALDIVVLAMVVMAMAVDTVTHLC